MYWGMCGLISLPSSSTAAGAVPAYDYTTNHCYEQKSNSKHLFYELTFRASSSSFSFLQSSRDFFFGSSSSSVFVFNTSDTVAILWVVQLFSKWHSVIAIRRLVVQYYFKYLLSSSFFFSIHRQTRINYLSLHSKLWLLFKYELSITK